ncbi:MAG: TonB-dependent receptor [Phocaeicola plebeius]|nr:TonB-dependent receptor [Phocaeicola plebeius]
MKNNYLRKKKCGMSRIALGMFCTVALQPLCMEAYSGTGQVVQVRTEYVTVNMKNAPLRTFFKEIEKQSEYVFFYKENAKMSDIRITLEAKNEQVIPLLKRVLPAYGLRFKAEGRQIVIYEKEGGKRPQEVKENPYPVRGVVTDESGIPLIGVNLQIKGKGQEGGTISDVNGEFLLTANDRRALLMASYIGFETQEIEMGRDTGVLKVVMKESATALSEVVVVGFATQKKENLTGAVATVDMKTLSNRPVQNVSQALQGVSPGLNITQNTGALGSSPSINIRGMATIGEGSSGSPLVLIDGAEGDINLLNPDDIDNISILKDASSAAIYGSRAAFGVILITTKSGKAQTPSVNYKNSFRWASPMGLQHQADSYSWALFMNDADLTGDYFSSEYLERLLKYQQGELKEAKLVGDDGKYVSLWQNGGNANVDWGSELFTDWAFSQEHQASIQGGGDKAQFYASVNYTDMNGMLKYGKDKYNRLGTYLKVNTRLWQIVELTYSTQYSYVKYKTPSTFTEDDYGNWGRQQWPMFPVRDNNGNLDADGGRAYSHANNRDGRIKDNKMIAQHLQLSVELLKNWFVKGELNYVGNNNQTHTHWNKSYTYDVNNNPILYGDGSTSVQESSHNDSHMTYSLYSNFSHSWKDKHNLFVTLGMQAEDYNCKEFSAGREGIIVNGIYSLNNTTGLDGNGKPKDADVSGWTGNWANVGFFGRVTYNYKERYLFEGNARYDGSSRFRREGRWVWSPSFSAAWNMAKENFWKPFEEYVNLFKIRASYGKLANQNTQSWYPTYAVMNIGTNQGTWLVDGKQTNIANAPALVSSSLTWENVKTFDVGFDLGALGNRLTVSFDWFRRDTENMVGPAPVLPSALGKEPPTTNNTSLKTTGWELSMGWKDRILDFNYGIDLSLSDNQTVITDYPATVRDVDKNFAGKHVGDIYGYTTIGIAKSNQEMKNHLTSLPNGGQTAIGSNWSTGDVMYEDINGDGKVDDGDGTIDNPGDLTVIGNSEARYRIGINLYLSWRGLDCSMFWQGVLKQDFSPGPDNATFYGAVGESIWWSQALEQHLDYFRNDATHPLGLNLDSYYPRPLFQGGKKNQQHQTRYIQNAAYMRLKNIQIGYTLPKKWTQKFHCQNLRVYVSGENLLTITGLTDIYDPETMWGGYYGTVYPLSKTLACGINLTF